MSQHIRTALWHTYWVMKNLTCSYCMLYYLMYVLSLKVSFLSFSPVFDGLFDFCSKYTGASLEGAVKLNNKVSRSYLKVACATICWGSGLVWIEVFKFLLESIYQYWINSMTECANPFISIAYLNVWVCKSNTLYKSFYKNKSVHMHFQFLNICLQIDVTEYGNPRY